LGHPLAKQRLAQQLGFPSHLQWFVNAKLERKPVRHALGIGVGAGNAELELLSMGAAEHYDLCDISAAGLDMARATAKRLGLEGRVSYHCHDANSIDLPPGKYGLITFMASLHHIGELEATLENCRRALAPGGVLWAFEYVGPNRFEYPDEHAQYAKRIYRMLNEKLHHPGEPDLKFPSVEDVIAADPTEAIHSADILPTMRRLFPDVEVTGHYGSLLFMIMWCLNYNAIYDLPEGWEAYGGLLDIETALVDSGALPHYFVSMIARKPTARQLLARRIGLDPKGGIYRSAQSAATAIRSKLGISPPPPP
jgi:SAM-dependent methyltransferase